MLSYTGITEGAFNQGAKPGATFRNKPGWPTIRAAVVRSWTRQKLLRIPVPFTGAAALRAGAPFDRAGWAPAFLKAATAVAVDARHLLLDLERAWFTAHAAVAGWRRERPGKAVLFGHILRNA